MGKFNDYIIDFKGLKEGVHSFEFFVEDEFFTHFPSSEIKRANLMVKVELEKTSTMMIFRFDLSGSVKVQCDRCLDDLDLKVTHKANLFVQFGEEDSDITDVDETMTLNYNEHQIDLSQHIYEYVNLSLPYKRVHPENELGQSLCNIEMIKKLEELSNNSDEIDPRWDKLKQLYKLN